MLSPRERRILTIGLPLGVVLAILLDVLLLAGFGTAPVTRGAGGIYPPVAGITLGTAQLGDGQGSVLFEVASVTPGWQINGTTLTFTNESGGPQTSGIAASLDSGTVTLATYDFASGTWTSGGGVVPVAGETLAVDSSAGGAWSAGP